MLEDPTHLSKIPWYPRFGHPYDRGAYSTFAAHIHSVGYGNGPLAAPASANPGVAIHVTLADASVDTYAVRRVGLLPLSELDMGVVAFPNPGKLIERVTLII